MEGADAITVRAADWLDGAGQLGAPPHRELAPA